MAYTDPDAKRANANAYRLTHKPEKNANNRAWRARNKERLNEKRRVKYAANPAPELLTCATYRKEHPKERCALVLAYAKRNPEKVNARNRRYQLRKRGAAICDLTLAQWKTIKDAFKHCCAYCGRHMQRLTQDHVIPLSKGGNHTMSNVVPACQSCNSKKYVNAPPIPVQPLMF